MHTYRMIFPASTLVMLVLLTFVQCSSALEGLQPFGVHLAFGEKPGQMVVMWHTMLPTQASTAEYAPLDAREMVSGPTNEQISSTREHPVARRLLMTAEDIDAAVGFPYSAQGVNWNFTDGGPLKSTQVLHRVVIDNLKPGEKYKYHVGSQQDGWSSVFTFTAKRSLEQIEGDAVRILAYCDMGDTHSLTLADVQEDVQSHYYDFLLHCGDLAYDFWTADGQVGRDFMREIQSVAAYLPYMVSPGNHEQPYNFSHYVNYFSMPGWEKTQNMFYSYDVGNVHVVSYNTEVFFFPESWSVEDMERQYKWLKADLEAANQNRSQRPWIIVTGHRPMYCVVPTGDMRCDGEHEISRTGTPAVCESNAHDCRASPNSSRRFPIEDLFYQYGVDLAIYGHVHDYERYFPVYNHKLTNDPSDEPYFNPRGTVHFTTGAGGNPEMPVGDLPPPQGNCHSSPDHWCAYQSGYFPQNGQSADFTYTHLTIYNNTHLHWSQWSSTLQKVTDEVWIVQHNHGSFGVPVSAQLQDDPNDPSFQNVD